MEICLFELNLTRTIEENETCKIEREIEREKCKENVNRLEFKNGLELSDLKNKTKETTVFNKEINMHKK